MLPFWTDVIQTVIAPSSLHALATLGVHDREMFPPHFPPLKMSRREEKSKSFDSAKPLYDLNYPRMQLLFASFLQFYLLFTILPPFYNIASISCSYLKELNIRFGKFCIITMKMQCIRLMRSDKPACQHFLAFHASL